MWPLLAEARLLPLAQLLGHASVGKQCLYYPGIETSLFSLALQRSGTQVNPARSLCLSAAGRGQSGE